MVSHQMFSGAGGCLWAVVTLWVVALSPEGVHACTPTERPPLVQRVHNADVVIHGYVMNTYGDGTTVYTATMLVYCMYKGPRGAVPMYINVTEAGFIPGHCFETDLPKRTKAIVLLRRNGNGDTLKPVDVAHEPKQETIDEIMKACNINVQYPSNATVKNYRDDEKCPTPVSADECVPDEKGDQAGEHDENDAHLPAHHDHDHHDHEDHDHEDHDHDHDDHDHDHSDHDHSDHEGHDHDDHDHSDHDHSDHDHSDHDHEGHDHEGHDHEGHDHEGHDHDHDHHGAHDPHAHDPNHGHSHDHHHSNGDEADDHYHDHDGDGDHDEDDHHFDHENDVENTKDHKGTDGKDGKTDAVVGGGDNGSNGIHSSFFLSLFLGLTSALVVVKAL